MSIATNLAKLGLGVNAAGVIAPEKGGTGTTTGGGGGSSPTITSIVYTGDDTATNTTGGDTVTLNGTNFNTGVAVLVGDVQVNQVTRVSATQITFVAPANTAGSYILYVINTDGSSAISVPGIQYSGVPAWTTASGSLGTPNTSTSFSTTIAATGDAPVSYLVVSGALPPGITLNTSTGVISGTTPSIASSTTYNFTVRSTDAQNQDTNRVFSITVIAISAADAPTIGTATSTGQTTATVAFTAPANNGGSAITSYTATSSPGGITGTLSQAGSGIINITGLTAGTSYTFTVTATNSIGTSSSSLASNSITTTAAPTATSTVDYLVVAGGGGGGFGSGGGGGGGGGLRTASGYGVTAGSTYTVTIGDGGPASVAQGTPSAGNPSTFATITATGGGGGASNFTVNGQGGNGATGGGGSTYASSGGAGTSPYVQFAGFGGTGTLGYNGGKGRYGLTVDDLTAGGGGGGMGSAGNGIDANGNGNGGAGLSSNYSGTLITYSGGGGGGTYSSSVRPNPTTLAIGRDGGANASRPFSPANAESNRGGGGAGGTDASAGSNGGSGVVIVRYPDTYGAASATTGNPAISIGGGYRIYKWTSSGSITF